MTKPLPKPPRLFVLHVKNSSNIKSCLCDRALFKSSETMRVGIICKTLTPQHELGTKMCSDFSLWELQGFLLGIWFRALAICPVRPQSGLKKSSEKPITYSFQTKRKEVSKCISLLTLVLYCCLVSQ